MHDEVFRLCYKTCWCVQHWTSYGGMYTKSQPFFHHEDILCKSSEKTIKQIYGMIACTMPSLVFSLLFCNKLIFPLY